MCQEPTSLAGAVIFFTQRILKHILALPSGAVFLYAGAYLMLRFLFVDRTDPAETYLVFPADKPALYWIFQPASFADEYLTGIKSRLGNSD